MQWKDVDFDNSSLSVRRALVVKKGGGFIFTEPKTKKSRRSIPISDTVKKALKEHRRKQLAEKFKLGAAYENFDLVFASEIRTPLLHGNLLEAVLKLLKLAVFATLLLFSKNCLMA